MGYFNDIFGIILLKDDAYKKVGNDKNAFKKYFFALFISWYCLSFFIGIIVFAGIGIVSPEKLNVITNYTLIILLGFLMFPFLVFLLNFILTFIPHLIGLAFGGRPKNYVDYFKVTNYVYPLTLPLLFFFKEVFNAIYVIWSLFMLYKSYKIIHRLNPRKAGWAVVANIFLFLVFIFLFAIFIFYLGKNNPEIIEAFKNL